MKTMESIGGPRRGLLCTFTTCTKEQERWNMLRVLGVSPDGERVIFDRLFPGSQSDGSNPMLWEERFTHELRPL